MPTQVNPTRFLLTLVSLVSLFGCGGGGGGGSDSPPNQTGRLGYAVDDYVVSGNVKVYRLGTNSVLYETTTGDKGAFYWPESITGSVRIEISGGFEDLDGLAATTTDRTPFSGPLVALVGAVETQTAPLLVTGVTTGIASFAANDIGTYTSAMNALPADIAATFLTSSSDTQANIGTKLETIKTIQRTVGYALISSELADDGAVNNSQGLNANSISATLAASASTSPISAIRDLSLQYCVASKIDKEPSAITLADLLTVTELYCDDAKVATVAGIETLENLTDLHLNNNDISDPSPLQRLSKLNYLNLADNRLASIAGLQSGAYSQLALDVEGNCISDITSLRDTAALTFTYYTKYPARQYPGCNRNDANIRRMVAKVGPTGAYILTYAATLNSLAQCQIAWGDGKVETASCDGKAHTVQHAYAAPPTVPVQFLINGVVKGTATFPLSGQDAFMQSFALQNLQLGTSNTTSYSAALGIYISASPTGAYDNATVLGLGTETQPNGVAKLADNGNARLQMVVTRNGVEYVGGGELFELPLNMNPGYIPAGTAYVVRLYKGTTLVSTQSITLPVRALAPSEMAPTMFPKLTLTSYAQLCPNDLPTTASWYELPTNTDPSNPVEGNIWCSNQWPWANGSASVSDSSNRRFMTTFMVTGP